MYASHVLAAGALSSSPNRVPLGGPRHATTVAWQHVSMQTQTEHCSCCGRAKSRMGLHALAGGAFICRRCGLWVALRFRRDQVDDS